MINPSLRPILTIVLTLGGAGLFHFATPLALYGQGSGTLAVQARVVDAGAAWTAHRLVEELQRTWGSSDERADHLAEQVQAPSLSSADRSAIIVAEVGGPVSVLMIEPEDSRGVALRKEVWSEATRLTVADLSR